MFFLMSISWMLGVLSGGAVLNAGEVAEGPDSLTLSMAQAQLDTLWAIYDKLDGDEQDARRQMTAFFDSWADESASTEVDDTRDSMWRHCDEVYNALFNACYPDVQERTSLYAVRRHRVAPYVVVPDSINFMVVEDSAYWKGLCSSQGRYLRAKLKHSRWHPVLSIDRRILYTHPVRHLAITCFLNGHRKAKENRGEKTPYHERYEWLKQFFPLCWAHTRGYYFLSTPPVVYSLEFNGTLDMVLITNRYPCYDGSTEIYNKINGRWVWKASFDGWME